MPEIVFFAVKVGFLALLWLAVLFVVLAVRADLFGARPVRLGGGRAERPRPAPKPAKGRGRARAGVLLVTEGALTGTRIQLGTSPVTIGRAEDSTLVVADDFVSTRHARFTPRGEQWLVEDLGSTNGTYLDREKVTGPTLVPTGVPVHIGKTTVELRS
ncbi:MAG TPA: FHA domain-containing protein [Mycobacteriales bacterium]